MRSYDVFDTNREVRLHVLLHFLQRVHVLLPLLQSRVGLKQIALDSLQLTKCCIGVGIGDCRNIGSHEALLHVT